MPCALSSQGLHSLQLEILLLAALAHWLCGQFWKRSRATVAGRGLFPTTHVGAIKRRKGPCSRQPLSMPALLKIPWSRCYSNWIHLQLLKERMKEAGILPAATLHPHLQVVNNDTQYFLQSAHWNCVRFIAQCGIFLCLKNKRISLVFLTRHNNVVTLLKKIWRFLRKRSILCITTTYSLLV